MKINELRVRINSYIVLVFLALMGIFGYALVTYQSMVYRSATEKINKSVAIFHQLNYARFLALAERSTAASLPMSVLGDVLKLDEFLFIRLYDTQGRPMLHLFNAAIFTPESVDAKFPAPRILRQPENWTEENIYLTDPPRVYALGVYSTAVQPDGHPVGYVDYVYDLSGYKNQAFYMGGMAIVFLLLTLLMLALIVNVLFLRFYEDNIQGYLRIGPDGRLLQVNTVMVGMLGYSSKKALLAEASQTLGVHVLSVVRQPPEGGRADGVELALRHQNGQPVWCMVSMDEVSGVRGELLYHECFVSDISDRKAKEVAELKYIQATEEINLQLEKKVAERTQALEALQRQAELLARTDTLTQLSNRRDFYDKTQHELNRRKRLNGPASLLMLDIDHFKRVNDTHGHLAGDQVLRVLAQVAQSVIRQTDILARLGGEEFAVFMPDTPLAEAVRVAERLRLAVADTAVSLAEHPAMRITVSIGVTGISETDTHVDDLLRRADAALYGAKEAGRDRVVCCSGQAVGGQGLGAVDGLLPAGVGLGEGRDLDLRGL